MGVDHSNDTSARLCEHRVGTKVPILPETPMTSKHAIKEHTLYKKV